MKILTPILAVLLASSLAAPSGAANLIDVYRAAQSGDAVFAAARAAQQAGQEKSRQGIALFLPTISAKANSQFNDITTETGSPFISGGNKQYNSHGYGFTLVQPLFRQQNWAAYSQAELQSAVAELQYQTAGQDLILRVAQAYFDVLIAQDSVQLAAAQKSAISEQLEQAKRNFEVGTATITDTYEAQARFDLIRAQELVAANDLEIKQRALQQMTNVPETGLSPVGINLKLESPEPNDQMVWIARAREENLQVALAQTALALAEKEVARSRGGHYPTLDLVANYNENVQTGGTFGASTVTSKVIGVELNVPLFEGGATQSKWREADANREKARHDLENARRNAELQMRQAFLGIATGIAQVQALQQALKSSESLLEASKLGQEVGARTNLDVLNAQQQLYVTQRDLYQAQYNYLLSQLRLKSAAGTLAEADLEQVNRALH